MIKTVYFTDSETGACSEIDTIDVDPYYDGEDYIRDCDSNADQEWCDMIHSGKVELH